MTQAPWPAGDPRPDDDQASVAQVVDDTALDNPVWGSLTGVHRHLALGGARARRFHADVSPFAGLSDDRDPEAWAELAALVGPGRTVTVPLYGADSPPDSWEMLSQTSGLQMVAGPALDAAIDPAARVLSRADSAAMVDLARRTRPGPFERDTVTMGTYLGHVRDGRLVAMAGERLQPPGWAEVSAVCTDPAARGEGHASTLLRAVSRGILDSGRRPFLHVAAANDGAIRLYEALGFTARRRFTLCQVRSPQAA